MNNQQKIYSALFALLVAIIVMFLGALRSQESARLREKQMEQANAAVFAKVQEALHRPAAAPQASAYDRLQAEIDAKAAQR